jgi:integrase
MIAARKGAQRVKTRFSGVYSRAIINKRTGKSDTAFDIAYRDHEGKFRWEMIGYASDGVNAAYANQRRGAILDGITRGEKPKRAKEKNGMTFGQGWALFDEKWLPNLANPDDERNRYKRYLKERFEHRSLAGITLLELEDLKQALLKKGLSASTVRLVLGDIRRMYRKLAAWQAYDGPIPTDGLVMPKLDNERIRFLTRDEAEKLLPAILARSKTWHDIAFISLHTGMRKVDILNLRGENLDFGHHRILVRISKTRSRNVPMTRELRPLLYELRPEDPSAYLFTPRGGGPHDRIKSDSDESFVRAVNDCKLNDGITDHLNKVVFNTLRHTFCSWLAMEGIPLHTIGQIVGHTSTQMTRRYAHLAPDVKEDAAAKIGEILRREKKATTADHASFASGIPGTS